MRRLHVPAPAAIVGDVASPDGTIPSVPAPQTETVELDADLVERAQQEADKRGITLKQLVDDAIRRKLVSDKQTPQDRMHRPRLGLGRSADGLSAAKTATEPPRPHAPNPPPWP